MGLSMKDMKEGTIVDHMFEVRKEDGEIVPKETIRRGIITKVEGNGHDSVTAVYVQFKAKAESEKTAPAELVTVFKAKHPIAKEAYRRIIGAPRHVGAEFTTRNGAVRRKVKDELSLSEPKKEGPVRPEFDPSAEADESGMDLEDSQP